MLSPRDVAKLLDQIRGLIDLSRRVEINSTAAVLLLRDALELIEQQQWELNVAGQTLEYTQILDEVLTMGKHFPLWEHEFREK
jgi:hypothetical protein